jgi:hypothetical protein
VQHTLPFLLSLPRMAKKTIALLMACFFLGGSILLPLGDFSLMRDIPDMYHNYTNITTPNEAGIIDFIGDYLLQGKELLGHNGHDKPQSATNNVQFQHQANPLSVALSNNHLHINYLPEREKTHPVSNKPMVTSDYHRELLRPPLS